MSYIRSTLSLVLDMLFPRDVSVARFDHLTIAELAEHVRVPIYVPAINGLAPFSYRAPLVRDAIRAAKFYRHERAAQLVGEALAGFVAEELAERRMYGSFFAPIVVPVPLHEQRLHERGFNQTEWIARALAHAVSDVPLHVIPHALTRVRYTLSQTHLSRVERLTNVQGAFSVPDSALVRGKNVVLVDDVVTTGATLQAARDALLAAGAADVLCVAVAH